MTPKKTLLFIVFIVVLCIGISLPDGYPVKFSIGSIQVDRQLRPFQINVDNKFAKITKIPRTVFGLDIAGGARLVYQADMSEVSPEDKEDAIMATRNIIEQRVNLFGVSEALVQTSNVGEEKRIIVELPGVADVTTAKTLIGMTAQLEVREFPEDYEATGSALLFPQYTDTVETGLTGKDLKKAVVSFDQSNGRPIVQLNFTPGGATMFQDITARNVGQNLPIFIDGFPVTNPRVEQAITGGSAIISGRFTSEEAKQLAIQLNSGALPVPIRIVEEKTVGPSLGYESIVQSVRAGLIGLAVVMIFMIATYGWLGVIATVALIIYGIISYAIFRTIPITLTVPGIAGFILSIGMAVDSNILIFERIKEELHDGRSWPVAMESGFGRAWDSIRDANFTTLLTCFILFNPFNWDFLPQFGLARGFAATLAIGIFVSLFTGVVVSRNLIRVFMGNRKTKSV